MQFLTKLKKILQFKILILVCITILYCCFVINSLPKSKYQLGETEFVGIIQDIKYSDNKVTLIIDAKEKLIANYYIDDALEFNYKLGDKIKIIGELTLPSSNTNFNLFNYKKYLLSKKINYIVNIKNVVLIKKNENIFYHFKNKIISKIELLENRQYLKAFILGDTSEINDKVKKSYQVNGISHLFAVSGMHISLITGILYFILKKINKKITDVIVISFLFFFAFLVNFSPSVMRSILLMIMLLINQKLKLNIKTFNLFLILTCCFLIYNPYYIYNTGFLFSFTITGFLILYKNKLNAKNYFINILKVSIIAFLASFPISIFNFFEINLLSPILNLLFVPLVTFVIFPLSLINLLFPILNPVLSFFINILESISHLFSSINILNFILAKPNLIIILLYYVIIIASLNNKKNLIFLIILFLIHVNAHKFNPDYKFTMLDQTTPNMIQGLKGVFARKPLISRGI